MAGNVFNRLLARRKATRTRPFLQVELLENRSVPAILTVGPGKTFATVGAAAAAANSGDTIRIDPITLTGANAYAVFNDSDLIVEGAGPGRTVLDATGYELPNRKGLFTTNASATNFTVRNIEFMGAHDPIGDDLNWAGLRQQSDGLTVQNCYFHDNDNGILETAGPTSNILIEYSEFFRNGYGDGFSHNIYIGDANSFTMRYSYSHDALVGHDVKSRAVTNSILYNWIGATGIGTESFELSFPDGGTSYIIGNVIRQDSDTGNSAIVDWGSENAGGANASSGFFFVNNTVVNDRSAGTYVRLLGGVFPSSVRLVNNLFAGAGALGTTLYSGPAAEQTTNLVAVNPGFRNAAALDYRLTSSAAAAIDDGSAPGTGAGFNLTPTNQYVAVASTRTRLVVGPLDIGAFEFGAGTHAIGIFRPSDNSFFLDVNNNGSFNAGVDRTFKFGAAGDVPIVGDWDGDGFSEIGVYRPGNQNFYLDLNGNRRWDGAGIDRQFRFGSSGDVPLTGDWNGDGKTDIGIYRPGNQTFCLDFNGSGQWDGAAVDRVYYFGASGDVPITGDWDGDGKTDIGVYRPGNRFFYLDFNGNGQWNGSVTDRLYQFGSSGDVPLTGDWNGDGKTEIGVYRPSSSAFLLDKNGNGLWDGPTIDALFLFGASGDEPLGGHWQ